MANMIVIPLTLTGVNVPLANINITDTNAHTYLTNPPSASGTGIDIIHIGNILGSGNNPIIAYSLWIFNNENQILTVQPLANIVYDGSLPDDLLVSSYTVNVGVTALNMFSFALFPIEYLSILLSYATAPTAISSTISSLPMGVYAILYLYYG